MHKLAAVALTIFFLFTSVLPLAFARETKRETNADRFRRGSPPLPPVRRDGAYQPQPSSKPPPTVSGFVVIRDLTGLHNLGYLENSPSHSPLVAIGVSPLDSPVSARLQATYSGSDRTLVATNALFPAPYALGTPFPSPVNTDVYLSKGLLFTNVPADNSGAQDWSYDPNTGELTIALPKPPGGTVPAVFAWDGYQDALELVTDVPTFLNFTAASEPSDRQPTLVRLFFGQ